MAAASYTTDLVTIATGDVNVDTGTWDESSDAGWDTGGAMVDDQNLYYNNTECVSAQMTKDSNGSGTTGPATIMYVHGSTWTIPTDGAVLLHHLWAAPPALNTLAGGGVKFLLGNGLGDFSAWNCSGSDFKPAPKGGWTNYALNPAVGTADDVVGAGASSPYTTVGGGVGALQQARGNPHACNAIRYGRCTSIYTLGDLGNGYATFLGYGLIDSTSTNKWNLLDPIDGGYSHQGLMSLGVTATAVDFRDANRTISIANTINVTAGFNAIEVHNAASNIEWTAITITALGTVSVGTFEAVDNATILKTSCTFTDMGTFIYQSNSTLTGNVYRRCSLVTTGSATFTSNTFDKSIASSTLLTTGLNDITLNTFVSDGSNHAVELISIGAGSMDWNNQLTDYVAGSAGSPASTSSTGNESIYVNVTTASDLTINVQSGSAIPSIRVSAGFTGDVNVVAGAVPFTVTAKRSTDGVAIEDAAVNVEAGDAAGDLFFEVIVTITSSGTLATVAHTAHGLSTGAKVNIRNANEIDYIGVQTITVTGVNSYTYVMANATTSPATGTINSTEMILSGLTDINGEISFTRTYGVNQVYRGNARKTDVSPYFKTANINGTLNKDTGASISANLTSDE